MALVHCYCPRCNKPTLFGPTGGCVNLLGDGTTCGYGLPIRYSTGNRHYRAKTIKHTKPPPDDFRGEWSWVSSVDQYEQFQQQTLEHGCVKLDPQNDYLFLWHAPSGASPIATLALSEDSAVTNASGTIMPLNSKPQNFHHFYDNMRPHFVDIASGPDLIIEKPSVEHPSEYWVKQGGNLIYTWNPPS